MSNTALFTCNLDTGVYTNPDIEQGLLSFARGNDRKYSVYAASIRNDFADYFVSMKEKLFVNIHEGRILIKMHVLSNVNKKKKI